MRKINFIVIISFLTIFLGCKSKEEKFLEKHQVLFYQTKDFESFVKEAKIKPEEAWDLMVGYSKSNQINQPHLLFFIIDGNYTFTSYMHPKIPDAYTGGIWVNANTGDIKEVKNGIFLQAYNKYEWKD